MTTLTRLAAHIHEHLSRCRDAPLDAATTRPAELAKRLCSTYGGLENAHSEETVFEDICDLLWRYSEHATNPRHFGLTRPTVDAMSVVADALVSLYDPNLATWDFSPAAHQIERFTLDVFAKRFGAEFANGASHFTSGGQEANHTAVAVALTNHFENVGHEGLRGLHAPPVMYMSAEGHHSFDKVAHVTGIGRRAVRQIATTAGLTMDVDALVKQIERDRGQGCAPFMIAATAGTINAGVIDPLDELADVSHRYGLWFHVDAAYGGGVVLSERLRSLLDGIARADSITCDAHKLVSVPTGAGMFFCRHRDAVAATFGTNAAYVPDQVDDGRAYPYITSMQWSRRFIGLKVFLMFATRGLRDIARRIEHQVELGNELRGRLRASGWRVLNDTALPVVCFTHPHLPPGSDAVVVRELKRRQVAWISKTTLPGDIAVLRASITNYNTTSEDLKVLVDGLGEIVRERRAEEKANDEYRTRNSECRSDFI